MLQQSAPANSGLLSVAHQSGPQNSSSVVPPQVIHRPTISQSMPQTRLNTLHVNQTQTQENKINSKLQKILNFFFLCKIHGYRQKFSKIRVDHLPPKSSRKFLLCSPAFWTGSGDEKTVRSQKRDGSCILACQCEFRDQKCINLWLFCSVLSPSPK